MADKNVCPTPGGPAALSANFGIQADHSPGRALTLDYFTFSPFPNTKHANACQVWTQLQQVLAQTATAAPVRPSGGAGNRTHRATWRSCVHAWISILASLSNWSMSG